MERREHQLAPGEVLLATLEEDAAGPEDRLEGERTSWRQAVLAIGENGPNHLRVRDQDHRRLEAGEHDAERVAVAPAARVHEVDRPVEPGEHLDARRKPRAPGQRGHEPIVAIASVSRL
jgi:hypothetical protein